MACAAPSSGLSRSRFTTQRKTRCVRVQCALNLFSSPKSLGQKFNKYQTIPLLQRSQLQPSNTNALSALVTEAPEKFSKDATGRIVFQGVHHVALLCNSLERSLEFYQGVLGLEVNPDRPHHKLPYRGAWLWIGPEMIHLMELPNPDPSEGRPAHGGRDRHFCVAVNSIDPLVEKLDAAGVDYTKSMSGRPAVFFRDPDMNCLECVEIEAWR